MARSDGNGTGNNKFAWPKKEIILKSKMKGFKWLMCIGNDGKDWEKDRGSRHVTLISIRDATIITNNNGHYVLLRDIVFLLKCEVILSKCFWVWKGKRGLVKTVEMDGDLM